MIKDLNRIAKDTNKFLNLYIKRQSKTELIRSMRYGLLPGGKKIRSKILIDVGKIFNLNYRSLIKIGAAVECIHAYSLIHDDLPCMDNDSIRRGKLSTHKKFGESTAVLSGNSLLTLAFEILSDKNFNANWFSDKSGTNISKKNKYYSEYTFHYWLWKNHLSKIQDGWIGFCQYRKFWSTENKNLLPNSLNELNSLVLKEIPKEYESFDVILGEESSVSKLKTMKFLKRGLDDFIRFYSSAKPKKSKGISS